ncbi:trypsin-like serine peptidase [Litorisediminicola beolgyonensis]|uniref:Serine protease n=1 Tax=Litorisediminicola beolgyonensis TaxID=1173614 RepID=A0ABW3ZCX7_9RHOB
MIAPARLVAALLAALTLSGPASAQSALEALDQRGKMLGWEGVGRIDHAGGICTGTLIAPDLVLTAAHCVDRLGRAPSPGRVVFRAGYHSGRAMAERSVARIAIAEGYLGDPNGRIRADMIARDVALLKLDAPVASAEADPFRVAATGTSGDRVSVVSYGRGREEVLSRQAECSVIGRFEGGVLGFDCDVTFGSSGAPVFVREDGRTRILSIVSAGSENAAYGMTLSNTVAALTATIRQPLPPPRVSSGMRTVTARGATTWRTVGEDKAEGQTNWRTGPGGAKFVRPGE